jgi:hypothetical protein
MWVAPTEGTVGLGGLCKRPIGGDGDERLNGRFD